MGAVLRAAPRASTEAKEREVYKYGAVLSAALRATRNAVVQRDEKMRRCKCRETKRDDGCKLVRDAQLEAGRGKGVRDRESKKRTNGLVC